jgi:hypothetical protein
LLDAVVCGRRVDGSDEEVHLVDMRLHPQDLLHKNCMHAHTITHTETIHQFLYIINTW